VNAELLDRAIDGNTSALATVEGELLRAWTTHERDELDQALTHLAQQAGTGRPAATEIVLRFVRRSGALRPTIGRYVPESEIDDVEQKTLIAVQRSVGSFQARSRFMTWLHSVGVNTALAHQRALSRRPELPDMLDSAESDAGRISSVVAQRADIGMAARSLTPEQRRALTLWEQGYSYEDIATSVGAPVGTVRSRISRARERLRELTSVDDTARGRPDG
jgi:RNA polymerase sigma-70 factor (ECF subfamily)